MMQATFSGKALLIGIDHYPHFPEHPLRGACRDARRLEEYLVGRRGFNPGDIEVLIDAAAGRQGIWQALERLLERSHEGDCVVFFFAGHGTRRWQPGRRRADDYLGCIVPSDSAHRGTAPNLDISGEELSAWLRQLGTVTDNIVLIFDSCHSGALLRDAGSAVRWVEPDRRAEQHRPDDWPWSIERLDGALRGTGSWVPRSRSHTVLAACRVSEVARELSVSEGGVCGAFTHHLLEQLSKSDEETTYRDLIEAVRLAFREPSPRQTPQAEGAVDRRLFAVEALIPMRFVSVVARDAQHVQLGSGAVHRTTRGSCWHVFPPATKVATSSAGLGTVRVTTVTSTRSEAEVISERPPGAVMPGCRAVLAEPGEDWLPITVRLEGSALGSDLENELEVMIASSPWLCLAEPDTEPAVRVTTKTFGGYDGPRVVILDHLDQLVAPHRALEPVATTSSSVVDNLESRARYRRTLELSNPDENLLDGKIRMVVHRRDPDQGWIPAQPRGPFGMADFYEGEDFAVELTNLHDEPVFLYLLALGVGGAIDPLYPDVEDMWRPIMPGHSVIVGDWRKRGLKFYIPKEYPYENPGASTSGTETLKLFATLEGTDFRTVFQDSLRSAWNAREMATSGDFGGLLGRLFLAAEHREVRRVDMGRNLPWTSLELPLLLIRKEKRQ